MNEQLKAKIDRKLDTYKSKAPLNKDFFYQFFEILEESKYHGDLEKIFDIVFQNLDDVPEHDSKEPLRFMLNYPICKRRAQALLDFFNNKLTSCEDKTTLIEEMFHFVSSQSNEQTSFSNLLAKFLSLKYCDEIMLEVTNEDFEDKEEDLIVFARLGDFNIGALEASYIDGVGVTLHEIRTLKSLTSQRIGLALMQKFFQILDKKYPEQEELIVQNVINRNTGAQRFYERLGGHFYTPDGKPLNREDISAENSSKGYTNVVYEQDAIKKLANADRVLPLSMQEFLGKQATKTESSFSK